MAIPPNPTDMARLTREVVERNEHLFQQLGTRDLPSSPDHLVIEMDIRPEFANVR